jgi:hypothetical protein
MRQASLWSAKQQQARIELWGGLPRAVRSEVVERLVHIVVDWAMKTSQSRGEGGARGIESATKPSRT